jgi:hypothetical protein
MAREETLAEVWYNVGHVALVISCLFSSSDGTGGSSGRSLVQCGARGTGDQLFYSLIAMAREETLAEVWYNVGHVALVISCFILF